MSTHELLRVRQLNTEFVTDDAPVHAVRDVSFDVNAGESVGIVGESGSGKSATARSILRLFGPHEAIVRAEALELEGRSILDMATKELRGVRGREIAIIFQDTDTALNPVRTIGSLLTEPMIRHRGLGRKEAAIEAAELLDAVGISDPEKRLRQHSHQLSGGMRQRVMIAMALSCNPKLIIADEITTALDVTIQNQILELMAKLREERQTAFIVVSHDLGVVSQVADRVIVMYGGRVVECATTEELFQNPQMPYTWGLLRSSPRLDGNEERLSPIEGSPPHRGAQVTGCPFAPRCPHRHDICSRELPALTAAPAGANGHLTACWGMQNAPHGGWLKQLDVRSRISGS